LVAARKITNSLDPHTGSMSLARMRMLATLKTSCGYHDTAQHTFAASCRAGTPVCVMG
jgi:hypothetical protein